MALMSVEEARALILADTVVLGPEEVRLENANGRTLATDLTARRTQPPFDVSAMDGYAVRSTEISAGTILEVIGEAPAGRAFSGAVGPDQAVRIFTGAPVPRGTDAVLIQENTVALDNARVRVNEPVAEGRNIRLAGLDFATGDRLLRAGTALDWRTLALAAAMDYAVVPVVKQPKVAILATGDELVRPGETAGPDQIVASNSFGVAAFVETRGGQPRDLGIVSDDRDELIARIRRALADKPDILVTLGGASVGDHDLVRDALGALGLDLGFWKVALRPGKPLMFGRIGPTRVIGLPGNPVSSLVGSVLFVGPLIGALLGQDSAAGPTPIAARLGADLKENDSRADYLRASWVRTPDGLPIVTAFPTQDSSMLRRFALSDCLIVRAPHAPAAKAGDLVHVIPL